MSKVSSQVIELIQTYLGEAGSLVSKVAGGAASTVAWGLFILVIAYFLLADAGRVPDAVQFIDMPGYAADLRRMGREAGAHLELLLTWPDPDCDDGDHHLHDHAINPGGALMRWRWRSWPGWLALCLMWVRGSPG